MIPITRTFLPPIEEYYSQLQRVWKNEMLTNRGELVLELEEKLRNYLDISLITLTGNGTMPLQIAIKTLQLTGEIITTPFSYVATTASIVWENCTPVFVDISPQYLSIDESKIEAAITSKTTAILATHVYGNPCNVEAIDAIARKHNLKVIYDAAHAFGVKIRGRSILSYGDVSTCSFHATKLFHTGEGGAMVCNDPELHHKLYYHHNFGHNGPLEYFGLGINAKMSEIQAALGLALLPHFPHILSERRKVIEQYRELLSNTSLQLLTIREESEWNYSYFPVIFDSHKKLASVLDELNAVDIFPRRYFYPSLNLLPYAGGVRMPVSENIAQRIACLPLYVGLLPNEVTRICDIVKKHI